MRSKYFDLVMATFVASLLVSNIASSAKIVDLHMTIFSLPLVFDAGTLLFPISYIFGDILTEVYGYKRARRVIWVGFFLSAFMSAYLWLVGVLPGEAAWRSYAGDTAYSAILGGVSSGGIIVASLAAYLCGELSNAKSMVFIKKMTAGRLLSLRTIGSTLIGQGLDTVVFIVIACVFGVFPWEIAVSLIVANYIFKVGIEVVMTPVTISVIGWLKKSEAGAIVSC